MTFHDLTEIPADSHAEARARFLATGPLAPKPFPPRYLTFGGEECRLEVVKIENLPAWRERHGVELWGAAAFVEGVGLVRVYWPNGK